MPFAMADFRSRPPRPQAPLIGGLVLALSVLYYALYIDQGFNMSDDGHFAQVSYELMLGTDPHAIRFSYGLLWFKLGQGLFEAFGPSYRIVQIFFYALVAATVGLVFATVHRVTRNLPLATLGAVTAALVPAFPPTVFYAFCTLLNVYLQLPAAARWRDMAPRHLVLPAAAVSLTLQIRPDFGYVFMVPLCGLIALGAFAGRWRPDPRRFARLAAAAAGTFLAVQAPLLIAGALNGYLDLLVADYLHYPKLLLAYALEGVRGLFAGGTDGGTASSTLLKRVPLAALWRGTPEEATMAFLIHAPVAVIGVFLVFLAGQLWRRDFDRFPTMLVILFGALATFPHYFLFRPDMAHIANFMPGYVVLVCVLAGALAEGAQPRGLPVRAACGAVLLLLAASLTLYLHTGLTMPGTGSIADAQGRGQSFVAGNGVAVRVRPDEQAFLETMRRLIEENSRPGDRIVCVPFCPGLAFMTGRRMLLRDYFVDDSFLISQPDWIDRAIERTRAERPPVIIILDWAVNGTEASRFRNWARRYVEDLEATGRARIDVPGAAVYLLPRES